MASCLNLSIPQFKQAAEELGEFTVAQILEKNFEKDYIPSYSEIVGTAMPETLAKEYDRAAQDGLINFMDKMSEKFGIPYNLDASIGEMVAVQGDGTIVFNPTKATRETVFHEFAHPLINMVKQRAPSAYRKMVADTKQEFPDLWDFVQREYEDRPTAKQESELLATAIGIKAANEKYEEPGSKNIFQRFWDLISEFFERIFGYKVQITPNTEVKDLLEFLIKDYYKIELHSFIEEDQQRSFYNDSKTEAQLEALKEINSIKAANARLVTDTHYMVDSHPTVKLERATAEIEKDPLFSYEGPVQEENLSLDWGNTVDAIAEMVLLGRSLENVQNFVRNMDGKGKLTEKAVEQVFNQIKEYKDSQKGSIFVTQVTLFNIGKKRAGTADIIQIMPDGTRIIIDVKSSKHTTEEDYKSISKTGREYINNYNRPYRNGKGSTKQKHEAQLSAYKGLAHSKGFRVDHLAILPIHLTDIAENTVDGATMESMRTTKGLELGIENQTDDLLENFRYTIESANDSEYTGDQISETINVEARRLHDKVLLLLEAEIKSLEQKKGFRSEARANKINRLREKIRDVKSIIALENFINELQEVFVEYRTADGRIVPSIFTRHKDEVLKKFHNNEFKSDMEALSALTSISNQINMYEGIIQEIEQFYFDNIGKINVEPGSNLDKVQKILNSFRNAKIVQSKLKPVIANILGSVENTLATQSIDPFIRRYERQRKVALDKIEESRKAKLKEAKDEQAKREIELEYELAKAKIDDKFNGRVERLVNNVGSADNILSLLENGYTDIPLQDGWLTSLSNLSNPIAANLMKIIKRRLTKVRTDIQEWGMAAHKVVGDTNRKVGFSEGSAVQNDDLITQIGDRLFLISEVDFKKYTEARNKEFDRIAQLKLSPRDEVRMKNKWIMENTETISKEDKTIKNPITGKVIVLERGIDTIIEEKKAELREEFGGFNEFYHTALEEWYEKVTITNEDGTIDYVGFEFRKPRLDKYSSQQYQDMLNNPESKKIYDFVLATIAESHLLYPKGRNSMTIYQLPSVLKTDAERAVTNGLKDLFSFKKEQYFGEVKESDADVFGSVVYNPEFKHVPIRYQSRTDPKNISRDLIASAALYYQSALRYEAAKSLQPLAEATLEAVNEADVIKRTVNGAQKVLRKAGELGLKTARFEINPNQSVLGQALAAMIDAEIYGMKEKHEVTSVWGREVNLSKLANLWSTLFSLTTIAGKPLTAAANFLQENAMLAIEAAAGEYLKAGSWAKGLAKYAAYSGSFMQDIVNGHSTSFIGQLIDLYEPEQDTFTDQFGHRLTKKAHRRLFNTSTLYAGMKMGEHHVYTVSMLALMEETMVKTKDGKEIKLIDAYELDENGVIKLKDGVILPNEGKVHFAMKEKMDVMNHRLHGIYNSFDKSMIERYAVGRQLVMFRKFIVPGLKRRFKTIGIDHNMGTTVEGYYNTFFRLMTREFSELKNWVLGRENDLQPMEKANIRRFLTEAAMLVSLTLIIGLLNSMYEDGDKEEKRLVGYPLYLAFRLRSEIGFYINPKDTLRILRSPFVSYTAMERLIRLINQLSDPFGEYQQDYSIWEKGDSKLWARIVNLFGINGGTVRPDVLYENLKQFSN